MADDETIVIRVNAAQGEAALRALGQAGVEASTGVESLGTAAAKSEVHLKDLTRNIGAGISLMSILRENLDALKPALEGLGEGIKFAATQAGASSETVTNLGRALDSLIHPSHIAANAIESLQVAWVKFQEEVVGSSTVIPHNVKTIEESLSALAAARKNAAAQQAEGLAAEQQSLDETAKAEAALEAAAVKSAEERAKAEAKAAEEIVAALAKEQAAMAAKLAQDEKALAEKLAKGAKLDTSQDTTDAQKNVEDLKKAIADLESQPILSADQINQLDDLKNKAADAQRGMADLNRVFTITRDDFLSESEAADAASSAWDVYLDRLNQSQFEHDRVMDGLDGTANSFDELGGSVDYVGSSVDDLSDSFSGVGDEAKKSAETGKEGLDNLTEGLTEAIPLAEQLRGILQEIVTLGSQADI